MGRIGKVCYTSSPLRIKFRKEITVFPILYLVFLYVELTGTTARISTGTRTDFGCSYLMLELNLVSFDAANWSN